MSGLRLLAVSDLADYLGAVLECDPLLSDLWVTGEVVQTSISRGGHCFFTLADDAASLRCVIWARDLRRQIQPPEGGMQIAAHGQMGLYAARGELRIVVDSVQPAGLGLAALEFARLRQQLEAEGLFDLARKRPLPVFPRTIGVVTSDAGSVWHDIQQVLRRRYPLVEVLLCPAAVQGDEAPAALVAALEALQHDGRPEVIIIARGGGSAEDLAAFNAEPVVRAVFACRIPVIAGVGHETDVTLVDLAADVRAPTPSAAAELCVPSASELTGRIAAARHRLHRMADLGAESRNLRLVRQRERLRHAHPGRMLEHDRVGLAERRTWLDDLRAAAIGQRQDEVAWQRAMLRMLEPTAVLGRGYALLSEPASGRPLPRAADVATGDEVRVTLADGSLAAHVSGRLVERGMIREAVR
ncbi:MAG: exodeoxyribonuclease VII large subunit [Thermomicrobiales bacterium]|nr:exodeoxyribonuclease VII large subunit [Thermomicrobiales bacterium]